jgi:hypothetical protein
LFLSFLLAVRIGAKETLFAEEITRTDSLVFELFESVFLSPLEP